MLTCEVDYLFKQSANPPQTFGVCLVIFELHMKYKSSLLFKDATVLVLLF